MKRTTMAASILLMMSNSAVVLAEELAVTDKPSEVIVSNVEASTTESTGTSQSMRGMGMMHKEKGQGGMMRGGGQHGKGGHKKDRQVV